MPAHVGSSGPTGALPAMLSAWQEHAANFEKAFAKLNTRRLAKVRTWEAQYFPDSVNQPEFPSVILEPGKKYTHTTVFKFSVR